MNAPRDFLLVIESNKNDAELLVYLRSFIYLSTIIHIMRVKNHVLEYMVLVFLLRNLYRYLMRFWRSFHLVGLVTG